MSVFLRDRIAVFLVIAHEHAKSRPFDEFGIVLRNTHEAERLFDGRVVCKNIQNEPFFDCLPHGIDVERPHFPRDGIGRSEQFDGLILGRGGKSEKGYKSDGLFPLPNTPHGKL